MPVNIPPKVRLALYILAALVVPLAAYLFEKRVIGKEEVTLISAYLVLINALAASKTNTNGI